MAGLFTWRKMEEHSIYYGKSEFYEVIRNIGGTWNDSKERPIVCLIKLSENDNIYWAIPMGNWEHRDKDAKARIKKYIKNSTTLIHSVKSKAKSGSIYDNKNSDVIPFSCSTDNILYFL